MKTVPIQQPTRLTRIADVFSIPTSSIILYSLLTRPDEKIPIVLYILLGIGLALYWLDVWQRWPSKRK